jgi:hypothetical protein
MVMVRWRRILAVSGPILALAGCRAIAGYRDLSYEPVASLTCEPVVLPTSGAGRIRLVNAGTVGAASDFCVRASGASDWGTPIFAGVKPSCDTGLAYATATVPFAIASGDIDVEAVTPGQPCGGKGVTSSATSIPVDDSTNGGSVMTVIRFGGGSSSESIVAHPEESAAGVAGSSLQIRVLNALCSAESINAGAVGSSVLPQTIEASAFSQSIPPGGIEGVGPSGLGTVDGSGYANFVGTGASVGIVLAGSTSAFAAFSSDPNGGASAETVFAIGDPASNAHPIRGLVCSDTGSAASDDASTDTSLLAPCTLTSLPTLSVDTVNVSLYGAAAPYEGERRSALYSKIAARQSDVMCVIQVDSQADKDAIASAASTWFPYVYEVSTDLATQATDPLEADGGTPAAPSAPPCSTTSATTIQKIYACVAGKCSNDAGTLELTDKCLSQACELPFGGVYEHGSSGNACFDCIIDNLVSFETLSFGQSECTGDTRAPFAFQGQSTEMILSHYPLANTNAYILPSTNYRRQVLYAEVQLEDAPIDFYCGHLTAFDIDGEEPYEGAYGQDKTTELPDGGVSVENGYEDEQDLQAGRVIRYIEQRSKSTGNPAIIAGEWSASLAYPNPDGGAALLASAAPEIIQMLDSRYGGAFVRADPPGYVPSCEYCPAPQNPYNGGEPPLDETGTFLFQFQPNSTTDETLWGQEIDVPIVGSQYEPPPPGGVGPAFEYYPRNVRVLRPGSP